MTTPTTVPTTADPTVPAGSRGTLDIRPRAVQHVVEHAAAAVTGTIRQESGLTPLGRSGFPRADVSERGDRTAVALDVAASWPCDVVGLTTRVRDEVLAEASRMTGGRVASVDVRLHLVTPEDARRHDPAPARRVR